VTDPSWRACGSVLDSVTVLLVSVLSAISALKNPRTHPKVHHDGSGYFTKSILVGMNGILAPKRHSTTIAT